MSPLEFMPRLAALVPRRRLHRPVKARGRQSWQPDAGFGSRCNVRQRHRPIRREARIVSGSGTVPGLVSWLTVGDALVAQANGDNAVFTPRVH